MAAGKKPHMPSRRKPLYENYAVYSPEGKLMFRCNRDKIEWYLSRQLAVPFEEQQQPYVTGSGKECVPSIEEVCPDLPSPASEKVASSEDISLANPSDTDSHVPKAIRLTFQPQGNGWSDPSASYYLEDRANMCVSCGRTQDISTSTSTCTSIGLTCHHVVPRQYRKYFPETVKSHSSHDVLLLCVDCHTGYAPHELALRRKYEQRFKAPMNHKEGWIMYPEHQSVKAAAKALAQTIHPLPEQRRRDLLAVVRTYFGLSADAEVSSELLQRAINLPLQERRPDHDPRESDHGRIVVQGLEQEGGQEALDRFVKEWRAHFLEFVNPRFLSAAWRVDGPIRHRA
ncbi:Exonuclease 3'-5' domain-containing protein 2 [Gaertneriomyces sp. JEL0708]|nr:Exonuclease 3'-5' domain-containing protein 2 [Gaertneriomyces sp. JEL0708]